MIDYFNRLGEKKILAFSGDILPLTFSMAVSSEEREGFFLGVDDNGRRIYLNPSKLPSFHGVIVGPTGSGKSTLARSLALEALDRGVKVVYIDPNGECRILCKFMEDSAVVDLSRNFFDPFSSFSSREDLAEAVASALVLVRGFGQETYSFLKSMILDTSIGSLSELYEVVAVKAHGLKGAFSFLRKFRGGVSLKEILAADYTAVAFPGISPVEEQFTTLVLLEALRVYHVRRGVCHKLFRLIFIDEAHRLVGFPGGQNVLVKAFCEARKFGEGFVPVAQVPHMLPADLFVNAAFVIAFCGPSKYVRSLESLLELDEYTRDYLRFNARGRGIIKVQGEPYARRVSFQPRKEAFY